MDNMTAPRGRRGDETMTRKAVKVAQDIIDLALSAKSFIRESGEEPLHEYVEGHSRPHERLVCRRDERKAAVPHG